MYYQTALTQIQDSFTLKESTRSSTRPDKVSNLRWKDLTKKLRDSPSSIDWQCYGTLCQPELKIIRTSTHLKAIWNKNIRPSITLPLRKKAYLFWMRTNVFIIIKCWSHILHNIHNTLVYISLFIYLSSFFVIKIVGALRNLVILGHNIWYHWIS